MGAGRTPDTPSVGRHLVAGAAGGLASTAVGHPFDTIKTRLQTSATGAYSGPLDCVVKMVRGEGGRALYRGASPALAGKIMSMTFIFGLHGTLKDHVQRWNQAGFDGPGRPGHPLPMAQEVMLGGATGVLLSPLVAPSDQVGMQTRHHPLPTRTRTHTHTRARAHTHTHTHTHI